ncbi:TetR/AcrR family transcriptional regulator [Stackebrandtia nassauensis]|uniref:Transcriptional regulator, TetR family n=1 Tax=Stackebrandtia nassauensis (strain DSM 44728 / CIP 108903 / NRRL B-16338 / NBRC 102104 / LLR-40K-21) TaxID=446470 RepID=D3PX91_STANL|nr:TetR/AcrR family transcriptional regulator [Stackebrandtia nassauensis]ADD41354.1 transcriptional regulator, TetR family [Stackebrandtia nassauensis DSM 44728]
MRQRPELQVGAENPPRERADAARNRAKILAAAAELFAAADARGITMDEIAKAAGVGRGTLYRRYPDVASIAVALLDEHESRLQGELISGPPPLGPGAEPVERLAAFYAAMVELLERHGHLVLGAETGAARFATGAYGFWRAHVMSLAREAEVDDPEALTDTLLAPLAPDVYRHQRDQGLSVERIRTALRQLAGLLR